MSERRIFKFLGFLKKSLVAGAAMGGCYLLLCDTAASAFESLGIGTDALIGNDLTDLDDDGDPEFDDGYDAIFDANHEPGFGSENQDPSSAGAGESAFNVFDNLLGPANDKWCCGIPGGIFEDDPLWVSAQFPVPYFLTHFTVSSANDAPDRDPIHWAVQGSNDGETYTDIYVFEDDFGPWFDRLEVIEFREEEDFPIQTTSYEYIRLATFDTINNQNGNAAYFQIGEIEYFGRPDEGGGGDYNGDGLVNVVDVDLQAAAMKDANPDLARFDENQDGLLNIDDRKIWINTHANTYAGDSNFDGEFGSSDLVLVFVAGKFSSGEAANWAEGDWNGDMLFESGDLVFAFQEGGFELGPRPAAAAVPEPGSLVLALLSVFGLVGVARRRNA